MQWKRLKHDLEEDYCKMSVFGDFQKVWFKRFPDSALPAAWEEDVRANLTKHKQKVSLLKEELDKEEFYVEYLERLLSDVEDHKKKISKERGETEDNRSEIRNVRADKLSKVNSKILSGISLSTFGYFTNKQ